MNLDPNDLLLFARVADAGSFSRAAESAGLPKSTVSRRLAALEAQLGERLLLRTTRKLAVTDFGHSVLEHARHVSDEVAAAGELAQRRTAAPSGRLRVSMPGDLASLVLSSVLATFLERYPAVNIELDLTARRVDLVGENFDVALRMGELANDASLAARKLATWTAGLFAAPAYLARRGVPSEPEALLEHDALRLLTRTGEPGPWLLRNGDTQWEGTPPGRATANSPDLLMRLACGGVGIAGLKHAFADPYVRSGELVAVLPDWSLPPMDAWAVFPGLRLMPARTRVFIDLLVETFSGPACTEVQARVDESRAAARAAQRVRVAGDLAT